MKRGHYLQMYLQTCAPPPPLPAVLVVVAKVINVAQVTCSHLIPVVVAVLVVTVVIIPYHRPGHHCHLVTAVAFTAVVITSWWSQMCWGSS